MSKNTLNSIVLGDCLDLLKSMPSSSVDLVISSPPYNLGKEYEKKINLNEYLASQEEVLLECYRVLKPSGSIFWQVGSYSNDGAIIPLDIKFFPIFEKMGMLPLNRIIWIRQHGLHARKKFSCRHETILWFAKSKDYFFELDQIRVPQKWQNKKQYRGKNKGELSCNPLGKNPSDIWLFRNIKHNHEEQTIHPCQFPEDMIERIILAASPEDGTILDPYMGTGTVAVVARSTGRQYIGAETDHSYHEVAMRRLSGKPNAEGSFANLKCLRQYIESTGDDIGKYRFDVQVGKRATEKDKAKIFDEQHHHDEFLRRLDYEEDAFIARRNGEEIQDDINLNGKLNNEKDNKQQFSLLNSK